MKLSPSMRDERGQLVLESIRDALLSEELTPPPSLQQFVGGIYRETGLEYLEYMVRLAGLQPDERILDVGCGSGRMAIPLSRYLDAQGSYEGFDVAPEPVQWCQANITPRFPRFRFQVVDAYNGAYNEGGKWKSTELRFPYEDGAFDFVLLTSVFTHMLPGDVEHYVREIARTLRAGGRCLATFFLLNGESLRLIEAKKCSLNFDYDYGTYRVVDPSRPEVAIAYQESYVRDRCVACGLKVVEPVWYGRWCQRPSYLDGQDILVIEKPERQHAGGPDAATPTSDDATPSQAWGSTHRPELQVALLKSELAEARAEPRRALEQLRDLAHQLGMAQDRIQTLEERLQAREDELEVLRALVRAIERGRVIRLLNSFQELRRRVTSKR